MGGAAADLTPEEIDALRENYSSENAASTVSMDLEEATSTFDVPATATTDPIFGYYDPIVVSQLVPERRLPLANPIDRVQQMIKARKKPRLGPLVIPWLKCMLWIFLILSITSFRSMTT